MRSPRLISLLVAALVGALAVAGCGYSPGTTAKEGAPVKLGDLTYNVVISRQLNPNDVEDSAYLKGAPDISDDQFYYGVFLQVHNTGDSAVTLPSTLTIYDTAGDRYSSVPVKNPFSLDLGSPIRGGDSLPPAESAAANGPIGGSMVLFTLQQQATENRPLELSIPSGSGESGTIELDL